MRSLGIDHGSWCLNIWLGSSYIRSRSILASVVVVLTTNISRPLRTLRSIVTVVATIIVGSHAAIVVVVIHRALVVLKLSLNEGENLLDELDGVRLLKKYRIDRSNMLLPHVVEVGLVHSVSLLLSANLGEFVVGHKKNLSVES